MTGRIFRGWWVVCGCLVIAIMSWSLGYFGPTVYLHAIHRSTGLSVGLVSSAITVSFLVAAVAQVAVGSAVNRFGPGLVITFGAVAMAAGVAALGFVDTVWQLYPAFAALGLGLSCLSVTGLTTTLAPWFERHQGRAVSTALLGASIGGMVGVPVLMAGLTRFGLRPTMLAAATVSLVVIVPIAWLVLRHRPGQLGLHPDGIPPSQDIAAPEQRHWSRGAALRTAALRSAMIAFGLGLAVQVGFMAHHVPMLLPALGVAGASAAVTATALAAFAGRVLLARFSDRIDVRLTAVGVLSLAAAALTAFALASGPAALVAASVVYGLTMGNVTTLSPIIVRREFGAASFGAIYGTAAAGTGLMSAFGPALYGALYDTSGSYVAALLSAAALDLVAAALLALGWRKRQGESS